MQLEGKAAIVTGGGTGVGRATAFALARGGCSVLVNYSRSVDEAQQTVAEIIELGVDAIAVQADVSVDTECRAMVGEAVAALGRVDILVNNAGVTHFIPHDDLEAVTDDIWQQILGVNVLGTFHCARAVKQPMLDAGGGEIVNVSSVAGLLGKGSCIPYAASKAALNNLTVALARALAPTIRVNGVAPGFITGRWLEDGLGRLYPRMKKSFEDRLPLGRVCEPDDVAASIIGLIAGSDLVTGQTLVCDGGMTIAKWNA
jgi:3-oxoacyl-[acyl-carrier protein] reductase